MAQQVSHRDIAGAVLRAVGIAVAGVIVHEATHFYVNFLLTGGRWVPCAGGLPFNLVFGENGVPVFYTCLATGGDPALNQLVAVMLPAVLGIIAMWRAHAVAGLGRRLGWLLGGMFLWVWYSLYLGGFVAVPATSAAVGHEHLSDGAALLASYGVVPVLLAAGLLLGGAMVFAMVLGGFYRRETVTVVR